MLQYEMNLFIYLFIHFVFFSATIVSLVGEVSLVVGLYRGGR